MLVFCFSIYILGLVLKWVEDNGGVVAMNDKSDIKSKALYEILDKSNGFYHCPIDEGCRSRMNVPLRVGGPEGDEALEKKFIEEAAKRGMMSLKGHRYDTDNKIIDKVACFQIT